MWLYGAYLVWVGVVVLKNARVKRPKLFLIGGIGILPPNVKATGGDSG